MRKSLFTFPRKYWMSYSLILGLTVLDSLIIQAEGGLLDDIVSIANDAVNETQEIAENVGETAVDAYNETKETAEVVGETAVDAYNETKETAEVVGETAVDAYNETKETVEEVANEVETAWENAENDRNNSLENFDDKLNKNEDTLVEDKDVVFKYYNRDATGEVAFNIQEFNDDKVQGWKVNAPLKIITHGWKSSDQSDSICSLRDEYLRNCDYNIITADWAGLAKDDSYVIAALKVIGVGQIVARLVNELVTKSITSWEYVHFIGLGLGGHVMGVAGWNTERLIGRITGLDSASCIFGEMILPDDRSLDWTDASFVDIIHTAGGEIEGWDSSYGHADFYPNDGIHPQPGCPDTDRKCSYDRAYEFFAESIKNPTAFVSVQCVDWDLFLRGACQFNVAVYMGDQTLYGAIGNYFLTTNAAPPFGAS